MRNASVSTRIGAVLLTAVLVAGFGADSAVAKAPPFNFEIRTLSNRADLISDGDALVEVRVPKNVPMDKVKLTLNGSTSGVVRRRRSARTLRGVLEGWSPATTCSSPTPTARAAAGRGPA